MRELAAHCAVQGNLAPEILLEGGDRMRASAQGIVRSLEGCRHVFNLGHGVIKETPPENVANLVEAVRAAEPAAS